ncbi:unnamed protein product [Tilletia laevis]|nr:unnamed protein product [Tilletia laevis]
MPVVRAHKRMSRKVTEAAPRRAIWSHKATGSGTRPTFTLQNRSARPLSNIFAADSVSTGTQDPSTSVPSRDDDWVDYGDCNEGFPPSADLIQTDVPRASQPGYGRKGRRQQRTVRRKSHKRRENKAFNVWAEALHTLVIPYLEATSRNLPGPAQWASLQCSCYSLHSQSFRETAPPSSHIALFNFESVAMQPLWSCSNYMLAVLVRAGLFPATPVRPQAAFSFGLLRFFRSLQDNSRVGAFNFMNALVQFFGDGTSLMAACAAIPSQDVARRQLRASSNWFHALETHSLATVQQPHPRPVTMLPTQAEPMVVAKLQRPFLREDDLSPSLDDLCSRCPACFGHFGSNLESSTAARADNEAEPQLIICLDGNFQHKRRRKNDAVNRNPLPPSYFLSDRQLETAKHHFESLSSQLGPATGCGSHVKAAIDQMVKTTLGPFDIGGVFGMTCRHGAPLFLADVKESGEAHYYAYALIQHLVDTCGIKLRTLGICYDISCKIDVSPRMKKAFQRQPVKVAYAVSLFHVYGHDYTCQLKYSPRRMPGFGLTDGESLERLWSALSDLVSLTRGMTTVQRRDTLCSRLSKLSTQHRTNSVRLLAKRLQRVISLFQQGIHALRELRPLVFDIKTTLEKTNKPSLAAQASTSTSSTLDRPPPSSSSTSVQHADTSKDEEYIRRAGIPPDLTGVSVYLHGKAVARREAAFQPASKRKKNRAKRKDMEQSSTVLNEVQRARERLADATERLSEQAQALHLPLAQWHALTDSIRRRQSDHNHALQARLSVSKAGTSKKAKALLQPFNDAVKSYSDVSKANGRLLLPDADERATRSEPNSVLATVDPVHITVEALFDRETLIYLAGLVTAPDFTIEPWVSSPVLADAMNRLELLLRLQEERRRIDVEVRNAFAWVAREQARLSQLHQHTASIVVKAHLGRLHAKLKALETFWRPHADVVAALLASDSYSQTGVPSILHDNPDSGVERDGIFTQDIDRLSRTLHPRRPRRRLPQLSAPAPLHVQRMNVDPGAIDPPSDNTGTPMDDGEERDGEGSSADDNFLNIIDLNDLADSDDLTDSGYWTEPEDVSGAEEDEETDADNSEEDRCGVDSEVETGGILTLGV